MASLFESEYRVRPSEVRTATDMAEAVNPTLRSIDGRLADIELRTYDVAALEEELRLFGVSRVTVALQPVLAQIQEAADLGVILTTRSDSQVTLALGSAALVVPEGLRAAFAPAALLSIQSEATPANIAHVRKDSWDPATGILGFTILSFEGSGTFAGWTISAAAAIPQATQLVVAPPSGYAQTTLQALLNAFAADIAAAGGTDAATMTLINSKAPVDSPNLIGTPRATVPAADSDSDRIATTSWVKARLAEFGTGTGYATAAGTNVFTGANSFRNTVTFSKVGPNTGEVLFDGDAGETFHLLYRVASASRWSFGKTAVAESGGNAGSDFSFVRYADDGSTIDSALILRRSSGNAEFIGQVLAAGTIPEADSSTKLATTAWVNAFTAARYAALQNPAFTGTPTAPTAAASTNTTQIATTAFVAAAVAALSTIYAPLGSPALTGTPTAPTAAPGTNTTQLATTAFAQALAGGYLPLAGGTVTGRLSVSRVGASVGILAMNSDAAEPAMLHHETAGVTRWLAGKSAGAETGANAGSDYALYRYADDGTLLGTPVNIVRSTGIVSFAATPVHPSPLAADDSTSSATTAWVRDHVLAAPFQPEAVALTTLSGLTPVADRVPYWTGANTAAQAVFTASGRGVVGAASYDAIRGLIDARGLYEAYTWLTAWVYSVNVAAINWAIPAGAQEVFIIFGSMSHNSGTAQDLRLGLSDNNGTSYTDHVLHTAAAPADSVFGQARIVFGNGNRLEWSTALGAAAGTMFSARHVTTGLNRVRMMFGGSSFVDAGFIAIGWR